MCLSCQGRTASYLPSLMVCLITAHVSEGPTAVCVDMCRSLDSPTKKSLVRSHCHLPCRQFLRQAMEAGNNLVGQRQGIACFVSRAPRLPLELFLPGRAVVHSSILHRDLESASLLLMSTSSRRSFAFMSLYSLYSSAIGVRSSFWTFLPFCLKKLSSKS